MTPDQRRDTLLYAVLDHAGAYGFGDVDPLLILAQSALETANFTSRRIVEDNNAFGMKMPAVRPTTATGSGAGGFAAYASLEDSVLDYFERQRYFGVSGASTAAYIATTMDPAHPYAQEGQDYIDGWISRYSGTGPDDVAWTVTLDELEVVGRDPGKGNGIMLALLVGALIASR